LQHVVLKLLHAAYFNKEDILKLTEQTCSKFVDLLASKKAVPGGGGAAALSGALGIALNSMVANFSIGKKSLLEYEDEHKEILKEGEKLKNKLVALVDEDAENFLPLSKAYGMKSSTEAEKKQKEKILQEALKKACSGPVEMIDCIYESILLHEKLLDKSSKIIISDIGVGVQCLKSALYSANLNVIINLNSITNEDYKREVRERITPKLEKGNIKAEEIYKKVLEILEK